MPRTPMLTPPAAIARIKRLVDSVEALDHNLAEVLFPDQGLIHVELTVLKLVGEIVEYFNHGQSNDNTELPDALSDLLDDE